MGKLSMQKLIVVLTTLALVGLGFNALADDGQGYGRMGKGKHAAEKRGEGYGPGGYCGRYAANLTDEELEKVEAERNAFFEATRELRQQMYQKDLELRAELAKPAPDTEKATNIQKELSALRADMDQQRLEHQLRMKAINPELGMGYGHQGFKGDRGSRGRGGHGNGPCWD